MVKATLPFDYAKLLLLFVGLSIAFGESAVLDSKIWAAPNEQGQVPDSGTCVVPSGGGYCTFSDPNHLTLFFPVGSVPPNSKVTLIDQTPLLGTSLKSNIPAPYIFLGPYYRVLIVSPESKQVTQFDSLVDLGLTFSDQDLARASNDPRNLDILSFDSASGSWATNNVSAPRVDLVKHQLHVTLPALAEIALFVKDSGAQTSAPVNTMFTVEGVIEWLLLGLAALLLLIGLIRTLRAPVLG